MDAEVDNESALAPRSTPPGDSPDRQLAEARLVARACQGDLAAFNLLVLEYQQLAYNVAYRLVGDPDSAADATQEAFIRANQALPGFRGGAFKSWLLRIVVNGCYDVLRARQRHPSTSLDALADDPDSPTTFPDSGETPEEAALRRELRRQIQEGLLALPVDQRTVIVLFDIQGLSYTEVAEATRSSLGTVKSRLSRGRAKLREYLQNRGELPSTRERHEPGGI